MTKEFLPCPFCGSEDIDMGRTITSVNKNTSNQKDILRWEVGCNYCGARVARDTQVDATKAWNTRRK